MIAESAWRDVHADDEVPDVKGGGGKGALGRERRGQRVACRLLLAREQRVVLRVAVSCSNSRGMYMRVRTI